MLGRMRSMFDAGENAFQAHAKLADEARWAGALEDQARPGQRRDYWSSQSEMLARAAEGFFLDRSECAALVRRRDCEASPLCRSLAQGTEREFISSRCEAWIHAGAAWAAKLRQSRPPPAEQAAPSQAAPWIAPAKIVAFVERKKQFPSAKAKPKRGKR